MPNRNTHKKRNSLKEIPYKKRTNYPEYKVHEPTPLLEFLLKRITNQSRNNIKSLLSHRQVLVDGAPITQFDFMLAKDDIVMIAPAPVRKITKNSKNNLQKLDIIFEMMS